MVLFLQYTEGPCLVHTITGDLLRALEGTENCLYPRLISVSSEGHCIIYYERGRFSNFSINGKLLAQMEINDSTRVNIYSCNLKGSFCQYCLRKLHIKRITDTHIGIKNFSISS